MKATVTTFLLLGTLIGLVGCQSTEQKRKAQQREGLQKLMLFERTDVSRDKRISAAEFRQAFVPTGSESVDDFFKRFDLNSDGSLSMKEWMLIH